MGVDTRRPPLPAPTDISSADNGSAVADDLATDVSRQTEKTSYSILESGTPVTINTRKIREGSDSAKQSQTSLLIEYFEGGKNGDKPHSRPSVRVRVTPSSRKNKTSSDHVQITETSRNRKPSYTRRISLGGSKPREEKLVQATDVSNPEVSNLSGDHPPVEVEVLHNLSDLSRSDISQNRHLPTTSDISSIPPDSMIDGEPAILSPVRKDTDSLERDEAGSDLLKTPARKRSRSLSRERITQKATQKVMEKLKGETPESGKSKSASARKASKEEALDSTRSSRRKSGKGLKEEDVFSGTESSMLSSNVQRRSGDSHSIRSGSALSTTSINNPKLLQTVEDAIRRLILPELNALKEEQKTQRNREKFERTTRDSMASASSRDDLRRRVSKTSSAPDILKPKAVTTGDSARASKSSRRSSRESEDTLRDEERSHHRKSSKDKHRHRTRDAVAAGLVGGALTAAALKHHDSRSSIDHKDRKKRRSSHSKSRSRATSISESVDESYHKDDILPLPMRSEVNPSELTRDSILTAESERDHERRSSISSRGAETPLREVARNSPREMRSPIPKTPPRTPSALRQGVSTEHINRSIGDVSVHSTKSDNSLKVDATTAAGIAAAAAAAAAVVARQHDDHGDYEEHAIQRQPYSPGRPLSPIQSVASYRDEHDEVHGGVPRSTRSTGSISSLASSPSSKVARTRKRPKGVNLERREDVIGQHESLPDAYGRAGNREVDDFFEKNHELNEQYRRELEHDVSPEESPINYKHMSNITNITNDSMESPIFAGGQDIRGVGGRAEYVNTPLAVESAVASLHEPSSLSVRSSQGSPIKEGHLSEVSSLHEDRPQEAHYYPPADESRALQDMSPTKERWQQIKEHARALSEKPQQERAVADSPHSAKHSIEEPVLMGASALPLADDPMPEIGYHQDDQSEVTTNPSEIKGPLGGYEYGDRSHWPTDPTPLVGTGGVSPGPDHDHFAGKAAAIAGGATAAAIAAAAANRIRQEQDLASLSDHDKQKTLEDEYKADPQDIYGAPYGHRETVPDSPGPFNPDEGYISTAQPGDVSPAPFMDSLDRYSAAYDAGADPFLTEKRTHRRQLSGQSHGMASPLYDSSTGRGMDAIQSKDIVALMDHLTVRDAQRNARDTEMLVTLVRSAAEMRNQFEEMKRFIAEQDALIMQNTMQHSNLLGQKILQGPRPQPIGSPRVPRTAKGSSTDVTSDDIQTKKRNVFRRAIKGLSLRSTNDLAKIEDMLMQLLTEVEGLKDGQAMARGVGLQANTNSLNSYENLRASGDPGYEPEGHAGTSSTPNQSGYLSNPSSSRPSKMHSSFQGHRISTVAEGDEEFPEGEATLVPNIYPTEERLLTPTQEVRRGQSMAEETPPQSEPFRKSYEEDTPKRKHKSTNSSIFGIPKISRWSKTTASSAPDTARKSRDRPYSDASRSGSDLRAAFDDDYQLQEDDRIRSTQSLAAEQEAAAARAYQQRPPSPLIPETDDPKYQAHRNSLNLQHPQPRPGPTHRHQTHLESQAVNFDSMPLTPTTALFLAETKSDLDKQHDQWGSNPSLILNRSQPYSSDRPYSSHSTGELVQHQQQAAPQRPPKVPDDSPLVPSEVAHDEQDPYADVPGAGYVSPHSYSSGHLAPLAPIEEVRYSLETDGGRMNYTPSPRPTPMHTPQRKITGPRPMGSRSPSAQSQSGIGNATSTAGNTSMSANIGTVRRKAGPRLEPQQKLSDKEFDELSSYRDSPVSETF